MVSHNLVLNSFPLRFFFFFFSLPCFVYKCVCCLCLWLFSIETGIETLPIFPPPRWRKVETRKYVTPKKKLRKNIKRGENVKKRKRKTARSHRSLPLSKAIPVIDSLLCWTRVQVSLSRVASFVSHAFYTYVLYKPPHSPSGSVAIQLRTERDERERERASSSYPSLSWPKRI